MKMHWLGIRILASMGVGVSAYAAGACVESGNDDTGPACTGPDTEVAPGCTLEISGESIYEEICIHFDGQCRELKDPELLEAFESVPDQNGVVCGPYVPGVIEIPSGSGGSGGSLASTGGAGGAGVGGSGGGEPAANCCYVMSRQDLGCVGGRPYRVDGAMRIAEVVSSEAWLCGNAPREAPRALTTAEREAISVAWAMDAATEHASIASFARFTLELMAVGAPSELVAGACDAMRDEIAHARACYAIASRFGGAPLGPGVLGTEAPAAQDLAAIARACVLEGCVGETVAAMRAERALLCVVDDEVRETLSMIVRDEGRHAELAWQFVRFAVERGGAPIARVVESAFEEARPKRGALSTEETPRFMAENGQLGLREQREVEEAAWRTVIEPCRARLGRTMKDVHV